MAHWRGNCSLGQKVFLGAEREIFIVLTRKELLRINLGKMEGGGDVLVPQRIKMQVSFLGRKLQTILLFHGRHQIKGPFLWRGLDLRRKKSFLQLHGTCKVIREKNLMFEGKTNSEKMIVTVGLESF